MYEYFQRTTFKCSSIDREGVTPTVQCFQQKYIEWFFFFQFFFFENSSKFLELRYSLDKITHLTYTPVNCSP